MSWVLDASAALSLALPDEATPGLEKLLLSGGEVAVPALWWYEIANGLASAERRKRLSQAQAHQALESFRILSPKTDLRTGPECSWRLLALAREHGISTYDAAYLELAERLGHELLTLDHALSNAAKKAGVKVRQL